MKRKDLHRIVCFVGLVLLVGMLAAGCGKKQKEPGRYYNREWRFSIRYPSDWQLKENYRGTIVIGYGPSEGETDDFQENVNVTVLNLPRKMNLDQLFTKYVNDLKAAMPDLELKNSGKTSVNNIPTIYLFYSYNYGGRRWDVVVYLCFTHHKGYLITGTALTETFAKYKILFEKIIRSFRRE